MKSLSDTYKLSNGVEIPCVGFGTWRAENGDVCETAVLDALKIGYRHIDTATAYGNEESVGKAVRRSGLPRGEIFITSKLNNPEHGYESTHRAFQGTMERLGLEYLDLYLIHWPNPMKFRNCWEEANAGSWKAFEELCEAGKIRAIGVSNFMPRHLEALAKTEKIAPMVNQIRLCPGETQDETVGYCRARGILLEAYSPLGGGRIFDVPEMKGIADKYGKTVSQVCLRWCLQMGWLPLPKSVNAARIRENADLFDFELGDGDVKAIAKTEGCGLQRDPDTIPF
jgi:diketogulonate reductase-like aldo/keto reductase